jgi:(1->4)-alpha-D-glucan 1-alpha-D-glucosylmutase
LWDLNLVDPDNRRPVDFETRVAMLCDSKNRSGEGIIPLISELLARRESGKVKLFLVHRALSARNHHRELFRHGRYVPLRTGGRWRNHLIAFAREYEGRWALSISPRLLTALVTEPDCPLGKQRWDDTFVVLPHGTSGSWDDAITGQAIKGEGTVLAGDVFAHFPGALLIGEKKP